jgi:hypothetical protein
MGYLRVQDGSDAVRVQINGILSGSAVGELKAAWQTSQSSQFWRQFVVDISGLTGYDADGHALLHQLHHHGATFCAGTPGSLDFLEEITSGYSRLAISPLARRPIDRSTAPRPRHKAGIGSMDLGARAR